MERGSSEKDSRARADGIPPETRTAHSETRPFESIHIDDTVLHRVLYSQWPEWNGQRPPEKIRRALLQTIPAGVHKNVPEEVFLDVSTVPQQGVGVFARSTIDEKTVIGPLPGRLLDPTVCTEEDLSNAWEISDECGRIKQALVMECFVEHDRDSWMTLIQTARHTQEQNLETFEVGGAIFYRATKDIQAGEELLVWYGLHIEQCFGLPCFESRKTPKKCLEETSLPEEERKRVRCVICHKGFNSRSNLRSHMRTHTQQKPFECGVCRRRFSQSSTLRNHTRLHTGEKPYKCSTCRSSYSQLAGLRAHQKSSQHQPKLHLPEVQTL